MSLVEVESLPELLDVSDEGFALVQKNGVTQKLRLTTLVGATARFNITDPAYGANTAIADNGPKIQLALNAARDAGGGVVYIPPGVFPCLTGVLGYSNVWIQNEGLLDFSGVTSTTVAVSYVGSKGTDVLLAGDATEGSDDLNVSGSGFTDGDWVLVHSTAVTGSTNLPKGEIGRLATASTMVLVDPLCDGYTTATAASVAKMTFVENVEISGLRVLGPADGSVVFSGLLLDRCLNVSVQGGWFDRCHFYGIGLIESCQVSINVSSHIRSDAGALAYGIAVLNACQDIEITAPRGWRLRHLVTHGGFTTRYGVPRRTTTTGGVASQSRNSGFDAHAGGEDINFVNCHTFGSESDGFTIECVSATLTNCSARDTVGPGFHINTQSLKPLSVSLDGCRVSGKSSITSRSAIQIQVNAGYESFDGISISGGVYSDCRYGLRCINSQIGRITGLTVNGGTYKRCGQDGDAVLLVVHAQDVNISGVNIHETLNSVDAISLQDVTDFVVSGVNARLPGTGGCRGVRCLTTCDRGSIDGVVGSAGASGIGVDIANTCTNITVGLSNRLDGFPTPVSMGTGAGNRLHTAGAGTPEAAVVANIGSTFSRTDGGAGTCFYVKEADSGLNTGWVAK